MSEDWVSVELHDPRTEQTWREEMTIEALQQRQRSDPYLRVRSVRPLSNDEAERRQAGWMHSGAAGALVRHLLRARSPAADQPDFPAPALPRAAPDGNPGSETLNGADLGAGNSGTGESGGGGSGASDSGGSADSGGGSSP